MGDQPDFSQNSVHLRIVALELRIIEWEKIIPREKCFRCFSKIFGWVCHRVGTFGRVGFTVAMPTIDTLVKIGRLSVFVGSNHRRFFE